MCGVGVGSVGVVLLFFCYNGWAVRTGKNFPSFGSCFWSLRFLDARGLQVALSCLFHLDALFMACRPPLYGPLTFFHAYPGLRGAGAPYCCSKKGFLGFVTAVVLIVFCVWPATVAVRMWCVFVWLGWRFCEDRLRNGGFSSGFSASQGFSRFITERGQQTS